MFQRREEGILLVDELPILLERRVSFPSRTRAAHSQPTFTHSVVRLHLNYSGFNPSPGPGLAASERGRSNGSSVLIPFLLVHRSISIELGIISPSLDLPGPLGMR